MVQTATNVTMGPSGGRGRVRHVRGHRVGERPLDRPARAVAAGGLARHRDRLGLLKAAEGRGYALGGTIAAMDWAVDHLGRIDIIHTIDPANEGSIALARKRGSTERGPVALPPPMDGLTVHVWGQTAEEWRRERSRA